MNDTGFFFQFLTGEEKWYKFLSIHGFFFVVMNFAIWMVLLILSPALYVGYKILKG